jgi:CheY-like chemotaxis protein
MLDVAAVTVLVVDDNEAQRYAVSHELRNAGFNVLVAPGGKDALALAVSKTPDVILTDVVMPGMSGFDVARRLKQDPTTASIPIVFYTAESYLRDSHEQAEQLGMAGLLISPVAIEHLISSITVALLRAKSVKAST